MTAWHESRTMRAVVVAILLLALSAAGLTQARDPEPDPARGAVLARGCLGCHAGSLMLGTPPYSVPLLFRQNAAYLQRALAEYANGDRANLIMQTQARLLNPQARADIATYLAGQRPPPPPPNSSGAIPAPVVQVCSACHGETGLASMPEVAVLSGQRADYIEHALAEYASGARRNGVMPVFAGALSADQRRQVAAYFARLGVLQGAP